MIGVQTPGHHAGLIGLLSGQHGQLGGHGLGGGLLGPAAERHQHSAATDSGIEHLNKPFLRHHIRRCQHILHPLLQRIACGLLAERVALLYGQDGRLGEVLCPRAVNELTREVGNECAFVELAHTPRVSYIRHMRKLHIIKVAVVLKRLAVFCLNDYCHTLLRLADSQLRRVQTTVFCGHAVEVDIQSVCQLANSHTHAAGAEVVRFLDEARYLGAAEEALQFALLGRVSFLYLAAAGLQRCLSVLFRRARSAAYAVAPCATA